MKFSFDILSDTEFEGFCFDLLKSLSFVNLSWRKGTGLSSSPSDQGRDIEGELLRKDVDGSEHHERWFIECKHYLKGVPPEKIQGAIAWANAMRPNVLLLVASNFFSNPAKAYLEHYARENRPPYRIKLWELKDLENLTAGKIDIRRKYKLTTEVEFVSILNNYHLVYAMKPHLNTLKYFIEVMDALDNEKRDEAFLVIYLDAVKPRFRKSITGKETIGELMFDSVDYATFRALCLDAGADSSPNHVHRLVSSALAWLFSMADKTELEEIQNRQRWIIDRILIDISSEKDQDKLSRLQRMLALTQDTLKHLPERMENSYTLYEYICENLVRKLLAEKPDLSS